MQKTQIEEATIKAIETVLLKGDRAIVYQTKDGIIVKEDRSKIVHKQENIVSPS